MCPTKRKRGQGRNCGRGEARTAEKSHVGMQTQRFDSGRCSFVSVCFLWQTRFHFSFVLKGMIWGKSPQEAAPSPWQVFDLGISLRFKHEIEALENDSILPQSIKKKTKTWNSR